MSKLKHPCQATAAGTKIINERNTAIKTSYVHRLEKDATMKVVNNFTFENLLKYRGR